MKKKSVWKVLALSCALMMVASSVAMFTAADMEEGIGGGGGEGVISLVAPSFISTARAAGGGGGGAGAGGGAFPEDEAGISAYINTSQTIDLEELKSIFTEVVEVGDNYIVGITQISDYGGNIGVHVYADTDGWLVAYLKMDEPAAKIMQWGTADVNNPNIGVIKSTTLEDALYKAGDAAGVGIVASNIKYYDFEFPNANGMMLFIRTQPTEGSRIHQVEIPADYMLFEASYYHYIYYYSYNTGYSKYYDTYWDSKLKVDETIVSDAPTSYQGNGVYRWWRAFETYKGAIITGTLHKIEISYEKSHSESADYGSAGVATVLIYKTA